MHKEGYKFVLYHAESFATYNFFQKPSMFYDHKILELMEFILCVGNKQRKIIEKFYPKIKNKIIITGDIKYDLPGKKYSYFLKPQSKIIKKKYKKKFILFLKFFLFLHGNILIKTSWIMMEKCRDILSTIKLSIKNGKRRNIAKQT